MLLNCAVSLKKRASPLTPMELIYNILDIPCKQQLICKTAAAEDKAQAEIKGQVCLLLTSLLIDRPSYH
jgi:hypothetical protein